MARTIDMTPTWAAIMPVLFAGLQNGTPEGQAIAREELEKLAAAVDSHNAKTRAAANLPTVADSKAESLDMARACLAAYPATDLSGVTRAELNRRATDLRDCLADLVEGAGQ